MIGLVVELVGAALLLLAYWGQQVRWWTEETPPFLVLNLVGAGLLAVVGWTQGSLGFAILNTVWALVAARALGSWFRASVGG